MTDSSTTTAQQVPAPGSAPVMEQIDPSALLVDTNVRADATLDKTLVESVRDLGVLVPVVAVRTDDGVRVRYGHRRTRAAIEAGQPTVPVWVFTADSAGTDVDRIVRQWAENEHRVSLTDADRLAAVEQLSAFGVSAAQISKRLRAPRKSVDAALSASQSTVAKAALARYDFLDLTQAAVLADFEDEPETVKALVVASQRGQFDHIAQQARDQRADRQRMRDHAASLVEQGLTVVEPDTGTRLGDLRTATDGDLLTADNHADCPGHAAYVTKRWGYVDRNTGYPPVAKQPHTGDEGQEEDLHDDLDDGLDDEDPDDPGTTWAEYPVTVHVCTAPDEHGHVARYSFGNGHAEKPKRADMSPEQAEAARAERRDVIFSNKCWNSSVEVRRAFLRSYLTRKTLPKGGAALIATALATSPDLVASVGANNLAADLLGCPAVSYGRNEHVADLITKASDARVHVLVLALVLAAYEDNTHTGSWRNVNTATRAYLTFLAECGYILSDVERRACGEQLSPITEQAEAHDLAQDEEAA